MMRTHNTGLDKTLKVTQKQMKTKRSESCNQQLLVRLRKGRGWTQEQLAKVTGYTPRLIRKAEAGEPISITTIADLAKALSIDEQVVHPNDLTNDPLAKSRTFIDGIYLHRELVVDQIEHFLDENIVCYMAGDPEIMPFAGEHHGIEALRRVFQLFFNMLEPPPDHDHTKHYEYISDGKDVVVWGKSYLRPIGKETPKTPVNIMIRMQYQNGKLVLIDDRFDTEEAKRVIQ